MPLMTFNDYDFAPLEPQHIAAIYSSGFVGTPPDAEAFDDLRRNAPRFHDAMPEAIGAGRGKLVLPYRAVLDLEPTFGIWEPQTTGDCVSHSTRNAGMIDYAIDATFGETSYQGRFATENIYGYRGHSGQGASCARLATYVSERGPGGFMVRKDHGVIDLTTYNSRIGHNWGRRGTPAEVNDIANENKALRVFTIKTIEEAIDALACGFGLSGCSSIGFADRRNNDGVAERRGTWHHAMAWIGANATDWAYQKYDGPLIGIVNSWGKWITGPRTHELPEGAFWARPKVANTMIRGGGVIAIASVRGYDRDKAMDLRGDVAKIST